MSKEKEKHKTEPSILKSTYVCTPPGNDAVKREQSQACMYSAERARHLKTEFYKTVHPPWQEGLSPSTAIPTPTPIPTPTSTTMTSCAEVRCASSWAMRLLREVLVRAKTVIFMPTPPFVGENMAILTMTKTLRRLNMAIFMMRKKLRQLNMAIFMPANHFGNQIWPFSR